MSEVIIPQGKQSYSHSIDQDHCQKGHIKKKEVVTSCMYKLSSGLSF